MGDKFENINGGIIATRGSTIALEGAIVAAHEAIIGHASTLNQKGQQDVAEALKELESLIAKASDSELALERRVESLELLKQVADEATKPTPNKTALKFLGQGFLETIKSAPAILSSVQKSWPIVSSLWI